MQPDTKVNYYHENNAKYQQTLKSTPTIKTKQNAVGHQVDYYHPLNEMQLNRQSTATIKLASMQLYTQLITIISKLILH